MEAAVAALLVGAHVTRPLPRRRGASLPRPRLRRLDPGAAVGGGPGRRVPAVVLERAPWRRLQVAAGHRRLRGGPRQRAPLRRPAGGGDDVVVLVRNTTEAINHLAYRLRLGPDDVVATTVVEHHANLLPWARVADAALGRVRPRRHLRAPTTWSPVLDDGRRPALLALTGASNVTGWLPPVEEICAEAHERGVPVLLDAAQLAPHRPLPTGPDFVAFSGHKLYAPFGAGALIGPRAHVRRRRPVPGRRRRRRPGRPRRGHLDRAARARGGRLAQRRRGRRLRRRPWTSWSASAGTPSRPTRPRWRRGCTTACAPSTGVRVLGPRPGRGRRRRAGRGRLHRWTGMHHALVAARLSAEFGIGVRHGCFCAHPYLIRLLGVGRDGVDRARAAVQPRRPQRHSRRGAGQLRARHHGRRRRRPPRRAACAGRGRARRPCPTCRTPSPATSGPRATRPGGARRTGPPARPAPGAERAREAPLA